MTSSWMRGYPCRVRAVRELVVTRSAKVTCVHVCGQAHATGLVTGRGFALINAMLGPLRQQRRQFGSLSWCRPLFY